MQVKVRSFGELAKALGREITIDIEPGTTVGHLLLKLADKSEDFRQRFLQTLESSRPNMVILINGLNIEFLEKVQTILKHGDTVSLLPVAAGG